MNSNLIITTFDRLEEQYHLLDYTTISRMYILYIYFLLKLDLQRSDEPNISYMEEEIFVLDKFSLFICIIERTFSSRL